MLHLSRRSSLPLALLVTSLAACSGSSSSGSGSPTLTLSVTDAASDQLSTFVIGLESVQLLSATNPSIELLEQPIAVDFAALSDLSRVLNIASIPADVYTGIEVTLIYDFDRVYVNGDTNQATLQATLLDSSGAALTGTQMIPIDFPVALDVTTGNYVVELDLDLNQSVDVDTVGNQVYFEPLLLPRVNRTDPKEHAIGGALRSVVLGSDLFRIGLDAPLGAPVPVVTVDVGPGTVFQVNGQCLLGLAGLSALDAMPLTSWVQAFGSMDASSTHFVAATVEAGTGSYNGGSDIVEGVIVGRTGGAGTDAVLTVLGHSNNSTHTSFQFNLTYTINTSFASTKVVRRGSATQFDVDDVNIGQKVRMFGLLSLGPNVLDVSTASDVIRMEPTWVSGTANGAPTGGQLEIDVARVDLRDVGDFSWSEGGTTPPNPTNFILDENNLGAGQSITNGTPVVALGFFPAVDDGNEDFVAAVVANRDLLPSALLIRDRANGVTVTTPTTTATAIEFAFTGVAAPLEKAVVDAGFAGETDITGPGITLAPTTLLGLGLYTIRDRTLNTLSLYLTFSAFSQGLEDALNGGATLFNVGAVGVYDANTDQMPTALVGVVVE
ncbi:MAG: hypothetical protein EXS08_09365 [Planctomycetes bacterium]|nr:hypothetical protein [Planctomycetota bacterium]